MRRYLLIVFVLVIFASCKKDKEPVVLRMFNYKMEYENQFKHISGLFAEKNKGKYKIEIESVPYEAFLILQSNLNEGRGWDIMMVPPSRGISTNALNRYFLDLTNEKIFDKIFPKIIKTVSYDNKVYAIPYGLNAYGLFYNKGIFERENIKPPVSFDEFKNVCTNFKSKSITPFSISGKDDWVAAQLFFSLISSAMGQNFDDWLNAMNQGISSFNTPAITKVFDSLDFYRDNGGNQNINIGYNDQVNIFAQEKSAMILQNFDSILLAMSKNKSLNIGTFPYYIDSLDSMRLVVNADFAFSISNSMDRKKTKAAKEFLKFLMDDEVLNYFNQNSTIILSFKNYDKNGVYSEIYDRLNSESFVLFNRNKIPTQVYERSRGIINDYINGDIDRNNAIATLDKSWSISK